MKQWIVPFSLFTVQLLFSFPAHADDLKFQQGQFTISAVLKNTATKPATITPVFKFAGSATWVKNDSSNVSDTAQITLRRRTFKCDEVYSYTTKYRCELAAQNFQQMLDDVSTHDANFTLVKDIVRRYYENGYYYDTFSVLLGKLDQKTEDGEITQLVDPNNRNLSVEFEIKNTGMHDI